MDQVRPQQAKWRRKDDHALLGLADLFLI